MSFSVGCGRFLLLVLESCYGLIQLMTYADDSCGVVNLEMQDEKLGSRCSLMMKYCVVSEFVGTKC